MDTQKIYSYFRGFRLERMRRFVSECRPTSETTILDVGGFSDFWRVLEVPAQITILRPSAAEILPSGTPSHIRSILGDGCDLREHADRSYDIVFSNSVIEHVGDQERQRAFAREALRVGRSVWVQTPAWEFPLEPHVLTPFFHWLPKALQEKLLPWTVWALLKTPKPSAQEYESVCARLLSHREMQELFPRARIITERFCGLPKSYIAHQSAEQGRR